MLQWQQVEPVLEQRIEIDVLALMPEDASNTGDGIVSRVVEFSDILAAHRHVDYKLEDVDDGVLVIRETLAAVFGNHSKTVVCSLSEDWIDVLSKLEQSCHNVIELLSHDFKA